MVTIAVMIGTPSGKRLMAAATERDAATMVEAVLLDLAPEVLPVPVWVQCADDGMRRRLTAYLAGVQRDLTAVPGAAPPRSDRAAADDRE